MTVQVTELSSVDFVPGKTESSESITVQKGVVALSIRVDRQTDLKEDVFTDTRPTTFTLLRSKDGKEWEEAVSFTAHGGKKETSEGTQAEYSELAFRVRDPDWMYRIQVDSPSEQKLPIQLYANDEYTDFAAPLEKSSNSVGYVDNEAYTGTNIASFTTSADLTVTGSDVAVYAAIAGRDLSSWSVSSCKWNGSGGSDMTAVSGSDSGAQSTDFAYIRSQFYRALSSIVSGSAKVYIAFSLTVDYVVVECTSWNTVDQSTPEHETWTANASSGIPSYGQDVQVPISKSNMTSASGNKIMGIALSVNQSYTAPISQTGSAATSISSGSNINRSYLSGYWSPTGSTHTIGFNAARGTSYAYSETYIVGSAVSIKEATGGGPTVAGPLISSKLAGQNNIIGGRIIQ